MTSRSSKDRAKRLRFLRYPGRDSWRRYYAPAAIGGAALALALWFGMHRWIGARQYQPGPLTASHATFGERCESCHEPFQAVQDHTCATCHPARSHSQFDASPPACRSCHVEHQSARLVDVDSRACLSCHSALRSTRPGEPLLGQHISGFADHPELTPLRPPGRDTARLRFNHRVHLTTPDIAEPLLCAHCHQPEPDGRYMQPIRFAPPPASMEAEAEPTLPRRYCVECHDLKVKELPPPLSDVEVPHAAPAVVREAVTNGLIALAVRRASAVFEGESVRLPGRAPRLPLDTESRSWAEFEAKWRDAIEAQLYKPLINGEPGASLFEQNKYCMLCHEESGARDASELPSIAPTNIRARWLQHAELSHRAHEKLACAACHGDLQRSADTADVNLPRREVCMQCHVDGAEQSARTNCAGCHLYHDTSKHPELRRLKQTPVSMGILAGSTTETTR